MDAAILRRAIEPSVAMRSVSAIRLHVPTVGEAIRSGCLVFFTLASWCFVELLQSSKRHGGGRGVDSTVLLGTGAHRRCQRFLTGGFQG